MPRLLAVELHHLGDAVLALPFLRSALRSFQVTVMCRPGAAEVFRAALPGAEVIAQGGGWLALRRCLPRLGAGDAAVCVWPDPRAHWLMKASGAGRRVSFRAAAANFYGAAIPWRRRRLLLGRLATALMQPGGALLTGALDRATPDQKQLANWAQVADRLGVAPDYTFPWLPPAQLPRPVSDFLDRLRAAGRPVVAVHAGGRLPTKRWTLEGFQRLTASFLPENRAGVVIIQPPGEPAPAPQGDDQMVVAPGSVGELAAVLAAVDGVVCNDSFASHLAAAMGQRVVTVFGSGDPAWFAPYQNDEGVVATGVCPFRPCVDRCLQPSTICLGSVTQHLVEKSVRAVILEPGAGGRPHRKNL